MAEPCDNFSSFLRVCCGRYRALLASGHIPADTAVPIRSLDADWVLTGERDFVSHCIQAPC